MREWKICWLVSLLAAGLVGADQKDEGEVAVESALVLTVTISSAGPYTAERDTRRANFYLTNKSPKAFDVATRFFNVDVNYFKEDASIGITFVRGQSFVPSEGGQGAVKVPPADYGRVTLKPGEIVEIMNSRRDGPVDRLQRTCRIASGGAGTSSHHSERTTAPAPLHEAPPRAPARPRYPLPAVSDPPFPRGANNFQARKLETIIMRWADTSKVSSKEM